MMMALDREVPFDFLDRLVDLVAVLRPDWDKPGIHAAIVKASHRTRGDGTDEIRTPGEFAAAMVNGAFERSFQTPAPLAWNGEHWPPKKPVGKAADHGPLCEICARPEDACRRAEARVHPTDRHEFRSAS